MAEKLNGVYSPTNSIKGFIPQIKKIVKCEYCGENEALFSIEVNSPNGECEESNEVCSDCVAIWFTETPEDVERMSIVRLEGKESV